MNILVMSVLVKWVCSFATKETSATPTCLWFTRRYTCRLCPSFEPWRCASCTYGPANWRQSRARGYFKPPYCSSFRGRSRAGPVRALQPVDQCEHTSSHQQSVREDAAQKNAQWCVFFPQCKYLSIVVPVWVSRCISWCEKWLFHLTLGFYYYLWKSQGTLGFIWCSHRDPLR